MNISALATQAQADHWLLDDTAHNAVMQALTDARTMNPKTGGTSPEAGQGDTGIIRVSGPLLARESVLAEVLGWSSYEGIAKQIEALNASGSVSRILLAIDSPGGVVHGVHDTALLIRNSRIPVDAHVVGNATSAAYWLASQCRNITISATGIVGSIGVKTRFAEKDPRTVLAAQSPRKELSVDDLKAVATSLNSVFIEAVAHGRNVSPLHVQTHFGKGGVFVGGDAVEAGLADSIASYADALNVHQTPTPATQTASTGWDDVIANMGTTNTSDRDTSSWDAAIASVEERRNESLVR